MSTREDKDRRLQVRAGRGDRDPEQEGARAEPGGDPSVQTRVRRPGRGLDLGPGGGPESQPERAGCRCGGGREGPGSLSPEDAGGKGSRAPPERCAPDPRSPGRGGAGPGPRTHRPIRSAALVALSQAEVARSSAVSAASGASAAAPQHPQPDPRAAASQHPAPPKMASPAPRPPHNAVRRDVTHPRTAGRGSEGSGGN